MLDEIGRASARFVASGGRAVSDTPGLSGAFSRYRDAMAPAPVARRREQTFRANFAAVWHEHRRLQPYIAGAMPRGFRRVITHQLLDFSVGAEPCHVAHGITRGTGASDWTSFRQRMRYVHELFRVHHLSDEVFAPPYGDALTEEIRAELGLA